MPSLLTTSALTALALLSSASSAALQNAIITIEASHGGAGQGLTNTTITVPLSKTYTNTSALDEVSTLYLTGSTGGLPLDSITCTPYQNADGTGDAGLAFTSADPSELSTNTVQVGSIVCITTHISYAPPSGPPGGPSPLSHSLSATSNLTKTLTSKKATATGSAGGVATSTLIKTTSPGGGTTAVQSTLTSTVDASPSTGATGAGAAGQTSATASASASLTSGNAASGIGLGSEFYGGLALAGFGLAFAL